MQTSDGYITMDDGVSLFYEKAGKGEDTLLVINGFYLFQDFKYLAGGRTVLALDLRNRARSDYIADISQMKRGVLQDVDDIEAVRRHFGIARLDLLGHSYAGVIPILYAMKYPDHAGRLVQIGATAPNPSKQYPAHLTNMDQVFHDFMARLQELQMERETLSPQEFCKKFFALLRPLYVFNPKDADKIRHWEGCHLIAELNLMNYWMQVLMPSLQGLKLTAGDLAKVQGPVLTIHGTKDRSAPYGAGREWASVLPNARLLTIDNAAHAPWIEAPGKVLGPIETFLEGAWPPAAENIESV
jgi:pimeloyl-ACP methyl ester carboxylesterase